MPRHPGAQAGRPARLARPPRGRQRPLYVARTGCRWRALPHDFPPRAAVYWCFGIRHILLDGLGLILLVVVHSSGIQDRDGARLVLEPLRRRFMRLRLIAADAISDGG